MRYLAGFGTGVRFGVHCDNVKNMARGIVERVLYVVRDGRLTRPPQPIKGAFRRLSGIRKRLLNVLRPTPIVSQEEYPDLYTGRKKGIYQRAVAMLQARGLRNSDSYCSTFLKAEKINFDAKVDPAPRVIQPRSPLYNVRVGRYLKLFEKALFGAFKRVFGYAVVLKGMNATQVGEALWESWSMFRRPVAVGLDASRFDQHVSAEALAWEHSIYNSVFRSPELKRLLQKQINNVGYARTQGYLIKYITKGCRMSGDINTSMGNCLLMSCMVIAYCESVGVKHRLANNGDDCVLIVEEEDLSKLDGLDAWMLDLGFTLTREAAVRVFEQIEFCQCHPVWTESGWRMVRNIHTAPSKDCVSIPGWTDMGDVRAWARNIGACGLSLTTGVPVWEAWYRRLERIGAGETSRGADLEESGMRFMAKDVVACQVSDKSRVSFYRAFGITPDMQVALEHEYDTPCTLQDITPMTFPHVKAIDIQTNTLAAWQTASTRQTQ